MNIEPAPGAKSTAAAQRFGRRGAISAAVRRHGTALAPGYDPRFGDVSDDCAGRLLRDTGGIARGRGRLIVESIDRVLCALEGVMRALERVLRAFEVRIQTR